MRVLVNGRYHSKIKTGMQHYANEVTRRIGPLLKIVSPGSELHGPRGHLWEQCYLPAVAGNQLLWSPNNTGPILARRQICTIHDLFPIENPEWFSPNFSAWYRWLLPRLTHRLEHIVAISEYTRERLIDCLRIPSEKITVVHNGVDADFFPRAVDEIAAVREQFQIPFPKYLLAVGAVVPRKNIARLLEAWGAIAHQAPDTGLVLAGPSPTPGVCADLKIGKLPPNVHFTGYIPQPVLPALYSGATALAFPSLAEGFGLPLLEAMACGTPVIASRCTALPEVGRDCALWVDPYDVESIADGIRQMISSEQIRADLRVRGLRRSADFTWEKTAAGTRKVLEAFA